MAERGSPLPCWRPRNVMARMRRAELRAPTNYPAVRHTRMIANALMGGGGYPMLVDEPEHCGVSIGVTVELFYKLLRENAELRRHLVSEQRPSAASGMRAGCPADAATSPAGRSSKAEDRR